MTPTHPLETKLRNVREHLRSEEIDGWLLYDYRGMNPIFADTVGTIANITRPCWMWVPVNGRVEAAGVLRRPGALWGARYSRRCFG